MLGFECGSAPKPRAGSPTVAPVTYWLPRVWEPLCRIAENGRDRAQDSCSKDTYPQAQMIRRAMRDGGTGPAFRESCRLPPYIAVRRAAGAAPATCMAVARA